MKEKFYVNSDERTCRVTLECEEGSFTGIATCSEGDNFVPELGLDIAYKRALLQVKQADVKQFQDEVKSYSDQINTFIEMLRKFTKARRKLNNAKKCLTALYREIHDLTQDLDSETDAEKTFSLA